MLDNIKRVAKDRGLTLVDVAEGCGLVKTALYRWDENKPSVDKVKAVADFLGVTVDELLREDS